LRRKLKLSLSSIESCSDAFCVGENVNTGGITLGKVKTEQIKRLGKELMARFPSKFNTNFDENKRAVDLLTKGTTTRVRNQTAGYITRTLALAQASSAMESEIEDEEGIAE
jgi:small subunit ribosomal protein S17e